MDPIIPNPKKIRSFCSAEAFEKWLAAAGRKKKIAELVAKLESDGKV